MKTWVNGSIEWINHWMLVCEERDCPWYLEIDKDDTEINLATLTEPAFRHYWEKHPEVQPPFSRTALDFAVSDSAPSLSASDQDWEEPRPDGHMCSPTCTHTRPALDESDTAPYVSGGERP